VTNARTNDDVRSENDKPDVGSRRRTIRSRTNDVLRVEPTGDVVGVWDVQRGRDVVVLGHASGDARV